MSVAASQLEQAACYLDAYRDLLQDCLCGDPKFDAGELRDIEQLRRLSLFLRGHTLAQRQITISRRALSDPDVMIVSSQL